MKYMLLFILLVSISCSNPDSKDVLSSVVEGNKKAMLVDSNDCSLWIETTIDRMTGDTSIHSKESIEIRNKEGDLTMVLSVAKSMKGFSVIIYSEGCIEEYANVYFLFSDDTKYLARSWERFNCKGEAWLIIDSENNDSTNNNKDFANKRVKAIRVNTNKGYIEADLSKENQTHFLHLAKCLQ